ncbi:MAG TPA: Cof-type HAD-IIB family hydrolase [Tissierellia bacterium]|nr:Cof-type HAD-IIB family hydrolase [Tissierellia bacterium]
MNYKMVVLDLDGTLLDDDKLISDKNAYILHELHKRGIHIVIATGRNYYMAKVLTEKIKSTEPTILANNGAISRYYQDDELIEKNYLEYSTFLDIYRLGRKYNLNPILHVDGYQEGYDLILECENYKEAYLGYIKDDLRRAKFKDFQKESIDNILSVCYYEDYEKLSKLSKNIESIRGDFNIIFNQNISKRTVLEFLNINGCKWCALKKYIDSLGIDKDQVIAMGDDNNDIQLIKNVGLGIAMRNATQQCKSAADYISRKTNNESGVYYELSEIFEIY